MSGQLDDVHEKDRKLDADLKGKLDFFIWHQRFKRGYQTWSAAPNDLKAAQLLTGEQLSTAEGWLLLQPSKLSDGERRYIMRSLAQSTQQAVADDATASTRTPGSGRRFLMPLLAGLLVVTAIALPRHLSSPVPEPTDEAAHETQDAQLSSDPDNIVRGRQRASAQRPGATGQAVDGPAAAAPAEASVAAQPAGDSDGDKPANDPIAISGEAQGSRHVATAHAKPVPGPHLRRLTALADDSRANGDIRTGLHAASEALHRIASLAPDNGRDGYVFPAMTALHRLMASSATLAPPLAASAAAPVAGFCEGGRGLVAALEGRRLSTHALTGTATPEPSQRPTVTLDNPGILLKGASIDPTCSRIAIPTDDDLVEVIALDTGRRLLRLDGHAHDLVAAQFSPDGRLIATASQDKTARLYDAASGRLRAVLAGHDRMLRGVAFSRDGTRIATASADRTVRVFEAATGRHVATLSGHQGPVLAASFSPDGRHVLSYSSDGTARITDLANRSPAAPSIVLSAPGVSLLSAEFTANGERVVGLTVDGVAILFDPAGRDAPFELSGPPTRRVQHSVRSIATSAASPLILAITWTGDAILHDATSGHAIANLVEPGMRAVAASFDDARREVLVLLADGRLVRAPVFASATAAVEAARVMAGACLSDAEWHAVSVTARSGACEAASPVDPGWLVTAARKLAAAPRTVTADLDLTATIESSTAQ